MRVTHIAAALVLAASAPVIAHPKLVSATPAPNSATRPTAKLQLIFSERLVGQFSGADLVMTARPNVKMKAPVKMPAKTSLAADRKTLAVALPKPLAAGTYRIDYHVVSADTHKGKGSYAFRVN